MPAHGDIENTSPSYLESVEGHLERVERSIIMASKALHLELAGLILEGQDQEQQAEASLRAIGKAAARIAALATDIATSTGAEGSPVGAEVPSKPELQPSTPIETPVTVPAETLQATTDSERIEKAISPTVPPEEEEKEKIPDLYATVVDIQETPFMALPEGAEAIEALVNDDNSITINGSHIQLTGERLFLFNSMMLQRNRMLTNDLIKSKGFKGDTPSFHASLSALIAQLNRTTVEQKVELIKKTGQRKSVQYGVNPALQLRDMRNTQSVGDSTSAESVKKK